MNAAGVPVPGVASGAVSGGVKRGGGHLTVSDLRVKSFGRGSVLGYLVGGAGQVAPAPQGACA